MNALVNQSKYENVTNLNRNLLIALGSIIGLGFLYYFRSIVLYILLAWVFSLLGGPIKQFFLKSLRYKNWSVGESGAALLTIFTFFAAFGLLIMIFIPPMVRQAQMLAKIDYQALELRLQKPLLWADVEMHHYGILNSTESLGTKLKDLFQQWFDPTVLSAYAGNVISAAGNVFMLVSVVSFILFFFLRDQKLFSEMLHTIVPTQYENKAIHAVAESSQMLTRYFLGLLIQVFSFSLIVGTILLILGVENAYLIGFFGGIMNLVPYVGPLVGCAFGLFITLSSGLDLPFEQVYPKLIKVMAAFAITQMIDNLLLQPYIFSKSVKAHPLEIFIVTLAAAQMGGLLGMVIAIPTYTVIRVIGKIFFSEFKIVKKLTAEEEEG
jgi:predicted PurR-regulated permease PerM